MVWGMGLGRSRTRVGKMADQYRVTQSEMAEDLGMNKETVSKICSDSSYRPNEKTKKKVLNYLRQFDDVDMDDLW